MPIENITNASVFTHFGRASIIIETFGIPKPEPLANMRISEARLARRYILALIECKKSNIDISGLNFNELKDRLSEIGMVRYTTKDKDYHKL